MGMLGLSLFFWMFLNTPRFNFFGSPSNNMYSVLLFGHVGAISTGRLDGKVQKLRFAFAL